MITVVNNVTLDGVMENPEAWAAPYADELLVWPFPPTFQPGEEPYANVFAVLMDAVPDKALSDAIRKSLETEGDRVADLFCGLPAFVIHALLFAGPGDFRIDQHDQLVACVGHVDHDHLLMHIDLGRGQPDTRRFVHGLGHVGDELLQSLIE